MIPSPSSLPAKEAGPETGTIIEGARETHFRSRRLVEEASVEEASDRTTDDDDGASENASEASSSSSEGAANFHRGLQLSMEVMRARLAQLGIEKEERKPVLSSFDIEGIAERIRSGASTRIVVMCGAGISVNAGIPDFRTPGTGLYDNLQRFGLPQPQAIFELDYFRRNPEPFYMLAKEMWPDGRHKPTLSHYFIRLLHEKGLLLRCYTQNIDSLETLAGLPDDRLVAAHGNFSTALCARCKRPHQADAMRRAVEAGRILRCPKCKDGLVKPGIVFFGEELPERFSLSSDDLPQCDLLIVMGTSLVVFPFAGLVGMVGEDCPRLLINREKAAEIPEEMFQQGARRNGFFWGEGNVRDALYLGDCDQGVLDLCAELGWEGELWGLKKAGDRELSAKAKALAKDSGAGSADAGAGKSKSPSKRSSKKGKKGAPSHG